VFAFAHDPFFTDPAHTIFSSSASPARSRRGTHPLQQVGNGGSGYSQGLTTRNRLDDQG
jgi:hypothetical protein